MAGFGAGIKTQWLRTDFTVDYLSPMKYEGTILSPNDTTAKISAVSTMFNGYLDLGTWYRVTPYLGAGAGAAFLTTSDYASSAAPPFTRRHRAQAMEFRLGRRWPASAMPSRPT